MTLFLVFIFTILSSLIITLFVFNGADFWAWYMIIYFVVALSVFVFSCIIFLFAFFGENAPAISKYDRSVAHFHTDDDDDIIIKITVSQRSSDSY